MITAENYCLDGNHGRVATASTSTVSNFCTGLKFGFKKHFYGRAAAVVILAEDLKCPFAASLTCRVPARSPRMGMRAPHNGRARSARRAGLMFARDMNEREM